MRIAMAQIEVVPGQPDVNFAKMIEYISKAKSQDMDLIIFPELCIPGYLIGDQWEEAAFIKDCISYDEDLKLSAKINGVNIVYGNISIGRGKHKDGRPVLLNTLNCVTKDSVVFQIFKTLLPNYREFDEPRHITPSTEYFSSYFSSLHLKSNFAPININGTKIGFTICEDGWDEDYPIKPVKECVSQGAELIINISCSPFTIGKNNARDKVFGRGHAKTNGVPLIYVNAVGIQNNGKTVYTFDGSSVAYNNLGEIVCQAPMFEEYMVTLNLKSLYETSSYHQHEYWHLTDIIPAMKYAIKKYLQLCNTKRVVIGISGGIDSAVAAVLYADVIGPENLLLVNMPSQYNSNTTKEIAQQIAENIGCYYTVIPIEDSVNLTKLQIDGLKVQAKDKEEKTLHLSDFNFENIQARDRSSRILSALSSAWNGVFTCNGNKSEFTIGYTTLYGDLGGFFAILGDCWKDQIYEIGRWLNNSTDVIPEKAFSIPKSAELSAEQSIEGEGSPIINWYHDRLFESWEQWWFRVTPEENLKWYLDGTINIKLNIQDVTTTVLSHDVYKLFPTVKQFTDDLERWYKLFKGMAVAKRIQAPPILGLTRRSYGFDYRDYFGEAYFTREYNRIKNEALNKI